VRAEIAADVERMVPTVRDYLERHYGITEADYDR